ncbi:MAG: nitroreductase family protein [Bacteroidales bacterium]|nr:nitroreductase family protein [Bacteroidales bacterium]
MNTITEALKNRYAVKLFDDSKKLTQEQVEELKTVVNLTASSLGMQPYRIVIIENQKIKEALKPSAYNQAQITTASHLFLFCAYEQLDQDYVEDYMNLIAETRQQTRESLKGYESMVSSFVDGRTKEELSVWAAKQAYIAIGNLLTSAAIAGIDACPMEGFDAQAFKEIMNLDKMNLQPLALVALGYKSAEDKYADLAKVRRSNDIMFTQF